MNRALPVDLGAIADARGPSTANPGLKVARWLEWGEDGLFAEPAQAAFAKMAVTAFKKYAKPDNVLSRHLTSHRARSEARAEALAAQGYAVRTVRAHCTGRLRAPACPACSGEPGFTLHRNLGVPYLPAAEVRRLVESAAGDDPCARQKLGDVVMFDAMPAAVPRLEADPGGTGHGSTRPPAPPAAAPAPAGRRRSPLEMLLVSPGTEIELCLAGADPQAVALAAACLERALGSHEARAREAAEALGPDADASAPVQETPTPQPAVSCNGGTPVRAASVQYQVHNGRVVATFRHASGRDLRAEEQVGNIAMADDVRKRLAKKKSLLDVDIEVQAVGNAWRITGILG
jgi:hypothetical protein